MCMYAYIILCAFMCACVCHNMGCVGVCMLCSGMKTMLIVWFILDLIRCNVLSLHVEDSSMFSGVGLSKRDIGAM